MKKGQIVEGKIVKLDFPNKGVMEIEEGKVVVKNTLPGQVVRCQINKARKGRYEGRLLEVLEKSSLESVAAPCEKFGACGGCSLQSLSYEDQLKMKENWVKDIIDAVCEDYVFEGIKGIQAPHKVYLHPAPQ